MADRAIRTVLDGMSVPGGPALARRAPLRLRLLHRRRRRGGPRRRADPETVANVPAQPSGLGWMPDGSMLVVSMRDRRVLRVRDGGAPEVHADLSELAPWHLNDMVVDSRGRAYVGNFGFDLMSGAPIRTAGIIRVDADGSATVAAEDLLFPNGTVILPDARTLVVAETLGGRLTAFDLGDDGALSNRRVWAKLSDTPDTEDIGELIAAGGIAPDGIALDAEGAIWVADALGGRVLRVREGGEILEEISPARASSPARSVARTAARSSCARRRRSPSTSAATRARRSAARARSTCRGPGCRRPGGGGTRCASPSSAPPATSAPTSSRASCAAATRSSRSAAASASRTAGARVGRGRAPRGRPRRRGRRGNVRRADRRARRRRGDRHDLLHARVGAAAGRRAAPGAAAPAALRDDLGPRPGGARAGDRGRAAHRLRRVRHRQGGDRGAALARDDRRRRAERRAPSRPHQRPGLARHHPGGQPRPATCGGGWRPASRSRCPTSGSASCTTCTPTTSRRRSSGADAAGGDRRELPRRRRAGDDAARARGRGRRAGSAASRSRPRRLAGVRAPRRRRERGGDAGARRAAASRRASTAPAPSSAMRRASRSLDALREALRWLVATGQVDVGGQPV